MTYLMIEIIDLCDDSSTNISDWFHFVWDRMRSIRKDIAQQDMCSLVAVELVEQCARFHIHCAGRLIAEELATFDPKLNTENLTKCLQSLKYMYHDLALKGIDCPNEAEFRAYIILLNLNDSNFLWEIKQLKSKIKKSKEVRFAISVYLAMDSNNYVKFFNLVHETNYLNACILMRYFVQIRTKALHIIFKSYTPRMPINFPIKFFVEVLGFENSDAVREFCEYHGLSCDHEYVFLDRKFFFTPDFPSKLDRALRLVEVKRTGTTGEVICGKILPTWESFGPYVPHNSFDENGLLKASAWRAEDQNYNKKRDSGLFLQPLPSPRLPSPRLPSPRLPSGKISASSRISPKLVTPQPQSNFTFSLPPNLVPLKSDSGGFKIVSLQDIGSTGSNQFQSPFSFPFGGPTTSTSSKPRLPSMNDDNIYDDDYEDDAEIEDTYDESNREQEDEDEAYVESDGDGDEVDQIMTDIHKCPPKFQIVRSEAEIITEAQSYLNRLISSVAAEEVLRIAESERSRNETLSKHIELQTTNQISYHINQMLILIAQDELITEYVKRYRYFTRWQRKVKERIAKRQILENIPVWIPTKQITADDINIDPIKISFRKSSMIKITIPKERIDVDFKKIISNMNVKNCTKSQIYWKILISLPDQDECAYFHSFSKKIFSTLGKFHRVDYSNKMFNICLRRAIGSQMLDEDDRKNREIGDQSNGIVFFVTDQDLGKSRQRFQNLLSQSEIPAPIPLTFVSCNSTIDEFDLSACLELDNYCEDNIMKPEYYFKRISYSNNNPEPLRDGLESALTNLAENHNLDFLYLIELQNTPTFFDGILGETLWKRIDTIIDSNPALLRATENINYVVDLFNSILDKFKSIFEHDLSQYFSLPSEFNDKIPKPVQNIPHTYEHFPANFKSPEIKKLFLNFINNLKLPHFSSNYESPDTPISFSSELKSYLKHIFDSEHLQSHAYYKSIQCIQRIFEHNACFDDDDDDSSKLMVSWLGVIRIISTLHLHHLLDTWSSKYPKEVVYNRDQLKCLTMSTASLLSKELVCYANDYCEKKHSPGPIVKRQKFL